MLRASKGGKIMKFVKKRMKCRFFESKLYYLGYIYIQKYRVFN